MARRITAGFGIQKHGAIGFHGEAQGFAAIGTPLYSTTVKRTGRASLHSPSNGNYIQSQALLDAFSRTFFVDGYFMFDTVPPAGAGAFLGWATGGAQALTARLKTDGTIALFNSAGTQVGSASSALSADVWYRIQMEIMVPAAGNGTGALWIAPDDGSTPTLVHRSTAIAVTNSITSGHLRVGTWIGASMPAVWVADLKCNDDTGGSNNTMPTDSSVDILEPVAVNSNTNWEKPKTTGSDTTNLHTALVPPPDGVAHSDVDANAEKYVFNTPASLGNLDLDVESYDEAGIPSGAPIISSQALLRAAMAVSSGSATRITLRGVSNPDDGADVNLDSSFTAAGTDPANWVTVRGTQIFSPTVTRATRPVVRARKGTAAARTPMVDFVGLQVEYGRVPADTTPPVPNIISVSQNGKLSSQAGADSLDIVWESGEDFTTYMLRAVPATDSLYTEGTLIEQDQSPAAGGTAGTDYTSTITDDEVIAALQSGTFRVKVFTRDAAGNWSI